MTQPSYTDRDNLEANRRGELTAEQKEWLKVSNPPFYFLQGYGFAAALILIISLSFLPMMGSIPVEAWWSVGLSLLIIVTAVAVPLIRTIRQHRFLTGDLAEGKVEAGEGQVIWRGNSYRAVENGRPLKTQVGFTLEPGNYTLYFLPKSRWLVATERQAMQSAEAPTLQGVLAKVLRCDDAALEANRQGELGDGQRQYLLFVCTANFFAALVALGLIAWIAVNYQAAPGNDFFSSGFLVVGAALFAAGFFVLRGVRLVRDLTSNTVRMEKGRGEKSASGGRSPSFHYEVGSEKFSVSSAAYIAFVEGKSYRVYYLPYSKRILNVEVG